MRLKIYSDLNWSCVLSFPTLEWAKPFLPILDLSREILEYSEVWKLIYRNSINNYTKKRKNINWLSEKERWEREALLIKEMVSESLNKMAKKISKEPVVKFERWMHFFLIIKLG